MMDVRDKAERCLVATCAYLALTSTRDPSFNTWLSVLDDACRACIGSRTSALLDLRVAATNLVSASPGRPREAALHALQCESRKYYAMVAATRHEALQGVMG